MARNRCRRGYKNGYILANVGNINACSAKEVGAALSKFSERINDDKFKKPEIDYKIL